MSSRFQNEIYKLMLEIVKDIPADDYHFDSLVTEDTAVIPKASFEEQAQREFLVGSSSGPLVVPPITPAPATHPESFKSMFDEVPKQEEDGLSLDDISRHYAEYNDAFDWMFNLPNGQDHAVQAPDDSEFSYFDYDKASS